MFTLDQSERVNSYSKTDHLGFYVLYLFNGAVRKYYPDYLIRLSNGKTLVLEIKGQPNDESRAKRAAMEHWVLAVNEKAGLGSGAMTWQPRLHRFMIYLPSMAENRKRDEARNMNWAGYQSAKRAGAKNL